MTIKERMININKEYCPLEDASCDGYYGHYCKIGLCAAAIAKNHETEIWLKNLQEETFNRKVEISIDKALEIIAEHQKCKPENITIKSEIKIGKVKPKKITKSCANCANNVEFPPPHTCDHCDAMSNPFNQEYYMWEPIKVVYKKIKYNNEIL